VSESCAVLEGSEFFDILRVLTRHQVDFILVGGLAAILEGAPVSTFDLDIVWNRTPENQPRLLTALHELNATYLDPAGRHIVPDVGKLATLRIHRLKTDFGPLDVMETIGHGMAYQDLVDKSQLYEIDEMRIRILGLETIILSKEQAMREKDRATLPILRRTLLLKRSE
jgi:hypothetical protein